MNGCRNILPVVAAVVALMLAVAACGHGGMAEQAARAAVDTVEAHYKAYATPDPLAEHYPDQSPYAHCAGNPVRNIDPTGMDWITANYDGEHFFFFDERIKNQDDVGKYYQKSYSISYLGAEAMVRTVKSASQEETGRYELYSDGTFTHNGILQETEYNRDGLLHIGNDRFTDMKKINNNFHGSYLGDDNPISKEDNNGLTVDSYAVPPIDNLDYAAFQHDKAYDRVGAKGSDGAFKDKRTYLADYKLAYGALKNLSDAPGWGIGAFILFNPIAGSKFWRSLLGL